MKNILQNTFLICVILTLNTSCQNEQKHYETHQLELNELITYFHQIVPRDKKVQIEFENNNHLFVFQVNDIIPVKRNDTIVYYNWKTLYSKWNVEINNIPDSILSEIHWDKQIFETLKNKLDKAGCISINNKNPIEIGYKRVFTGMSSYYIFEKYSNEELKQIREKRTDLHFICDSIAWDYDTGAI